MDSLSLGTWYIFKVQSQNAKDYSDFSATVRILAAQQPDIPLAPETLFLRTSVSVSWTAPFNGGSAITGYRVQFKQSNGTFSESEVDCMQHLSTAITCSISVLNLRASPYSLAWGSSVYARVLAINDYGTSEPSD